MPEQRLSPTVVSPGAGPSYWIVGDQITFKLFGEQCQGAFAIAETIVPPGGGPPPHVHHREHEMFYILDGEYGFIFGDATLSGKAGDALFLPKGIVHTFKNVSDKPGKALVVAAPCGFEKFIPEAGYPCTNPASPPVVDEAAIGKLMTAAAKYGLEIKPDHVPGPPAPPRPADLEYWVLGTHVRLKLTGEQTGGQFSVVEVTCYPGGIVPPHAHTHMHEMFYVLEGRFQFMLDGHPADAGPGTFIHVPPGAMHGFGNGGDKPAKLVDYHSPGGFEAFFEECGVPCTDRSKPPAPQTPDMVRIRQIFEKHGMTFPSALIVLATIPAGR